MQSAGPVAEGFNVTGSGLIQLAKFLDSFYAVICLGEDNVLAERETLGTELMLRTIFS